VRYETEKQLAARAKALGEGADAAAFADLAAFCASPSPLVRRIAASALGKLAGVVDAAASVEALLPLLGDAQSPGAPVCRQGAGRLRLVRRKGTPRPARHAPQSRRTWPCEAQRHRRRARLFKLLRGWGDRVQYSVFCCQLNPRERLQLVEEMKRLMNQDEDQTLRLDAGAVEGERPIPEIAYVGKVWRPEQRSQVV